MRLFISYTHSDKFLVKTQIVDILQVAGHNVWFDEHLTVGQDWQQQLYQTIQDCDALVYAITPESVKSEWCQWELAKAVELGKPVVPVLLQKTDIPASLGHLQYVDFTEGATGNAVARLMGGLQSLSPNQVPSAPTNPQGIPPQAVRRSQKPPISVRVVVGTIAAIIIFVVTIFGVLPETTRTHFLISVGLLVPTSTPTATLTTPMSNDPPNTPTNEPTLAPEQVALTPVVSNTDWTPVERDFNGVWMVLVPSGCFDMGSNNGDADEQPVEEVCINEPFWMDKYEVTNSLFNRLGGQAGRSSHWSGSNQPRERITWFEAQSFCQLRNGQLPTESEWEYAARGPDNLRYPWGNEFIPSNVAYTANTSNQTESVGSRPSGSSWVGALDLSGNVWEWVLSAYDSYPYLDDGRNDFVGTNDLRARVNRGGSWGSGDYSLRVTYRRRNPPNEQYNILGFRCVMEIEDKWTD